MISVALCWFNFRTRKRGCWSSSMFNARNEVYPWRAIEKVGCIMHEVCATSIFHPSATSRRQFLKPLSRRDVRFHVATSFYYSSVTSRRQFDNPLSRRDVRYHVATSFGKTLGHVATWSLTSRCHLVMLSATSRRGISRRDVG